MSVTKETPQDAVMVVERELRGWSWATGGWASVHAIAGSILVVTGGLSTLRSTTERLVVLLVIGAWATAALASWAFRKSFRAKTGMVAASASVLAGVVILFASSEGVWAVLDSVAHVGAGLGLANAVRHARALLYSP